MHSSTQPSDTFQALADQPIGSVPMRRLDRARHTEFHKPRPSASPLNGERAGVRGAAALDILSPP
jgi:hypothetical protein